MRVLEAQSSKTAAVVFWQPQRPWSGCEFIPLDGPVGVVDAQDRHKTFDKSLMKSNIIQETLIARTRRYRLHKQSFRKGYKTQ